MVFEKNEVIELSGGKKYIVIDCLEKNYKWYYYLLEITDDDDIVGNKITITTTRENEKLYIQTLNVDDEINKIFIKRLDNADNK